ncbi:MAG: permease-like cell division protein FtsX, partial [Desulfotomaculaceae bacterium]|nr:permease-like cell division protein FtsX [Desulfotomaculaceae bacterium]
MKLKTVRYYFREAFLSVIRNSWISVASIGVVAVSLLILGSSLLLVMNANNIAVNLESSLEISAFFKEEITPDGMRDLESELAEKPGIASVVFVSKEQALEEMRENLNAQEDILAGLEDKNPLPNAL